jgi:hypothetical protein
MPRLREFAAALAVSTAASTPFALFASPPGAVRDRGTVTTVTTITVEKPAKEKADADGPRIDLALLLDTSNSMDGLINQARAQLWKVVNDLASAEKNGKIPRLRVALYEYGNSGLPMDGGYVRQVLPLTDDLDKVSEELFALSTNGGDEYCGRVIEAATQGLEWSKSDDDLKLIVIAGNEPFTQGPVDYKVACGAAIAKGIVVNTIHCGSREEGIQTGWADGAKLADGTFSNIDQDQQIAEIPTPFDDELAKLSGELNGTFLFFGAAPARLRLATNQALQDTNAAGLGVAIAAERASAKASANYAFDADLVQEFAENSDALSVIEAEQLPDELKGKSEAEQKAILKKKAEEREKVQKKIAELAEKRKDFIAEERKKQAENGEKEKSLDEALVEALREQAVKKAFSFKE